MLFFVVLIGICFGSFGNVIVDRLPAGRSIIGRSKCDGCTRALSPLELIPVLSWIVLRGKCRSCHVRIPARMPLVELCAGFLAALAFWQADADLIATALLFLGLWALLLIAVIDLRTRTIPDVLTAIVFIAGLALHLWTLGRLPFVAPLIGIAFFGLQWILSRGRWVGSGDILLAGAIGTLVGSEHGMVWTLLIAYALGANIAIVLLLTKRLSRGAMIPFGPFLVAAAFLVLFLGDRLPPMPL